MNETTTAWRLVAVRDVRPVDLDTGKRIDLPADMLPECCRCGRRHAKVYEVTDGARVRTVGSGCVRAAFDGWEPTAEELRTARKVERKALEDARRASIAARAAELLPAAVAVLASVPAPAVLSTRTTDPFGNAVAPIVQWGNDFARVWCRDGLTAERRSTLEDATRERVAHRVVGDAMPGARYALRVLVAAALEALIRGRS